MVMDLANWTARPGLVREQMEGRYVRLEPLGLGHAETLFQAASARGAEDRFRWLPEEPPNREDFNAWFEAA
ncbi:MAG: GNAT family N-acetyltransferase, partial [Alphaproteobacteria bacterium]|nr:GNAT family N-acetyltransferase [Alphaproteobacteria bacterium]